jgi:hypothetical protein
MTGHRLLPAVRFTDRLGRLVFAARCECMAEPEAWYAPRLPQIYAVHEWHCGQVRARSRANHPSSRGGAA